MNEDTFIFLIGIDCCFYCLLYFQHAMLNLLHPIPNFRNATLNLFCPILNFQDAALNLFYPIPNFRNATLNLLCPILNFQDATLTAFCPILNFRNAIMSLFNNPLQSHPTSLSMICCFLLLPAIGHCLACLMPLPSRVSSWRVYTALPHRQVDCRLAGGL